VCSLARKPHSTPATNKPSLHLKLIYNYLRVLIIHTQLIAQISAGTLGLSNFVHTSLLIIIARPLYILGSPSFLFDEKAYSGRHSHFYWHYSTWNNFNKLAINTIHAQHFNLLIIFHFITFGCFSNRCIRTVFSWQGWCHRGWNLISLSKGYIATFLQDLL